MSAIGMVIMYTTVSTQEDAHNLAAKVIESKLAVCVNILQPHECVYLESGVLKTAQEVGLIIKILEDNYEFIYEAIKSWHPYKVPAMLSWPIEVNQAYSVWAFQQTHNFT